MQLAGAVARLTDATYGGVWRSPDYSSAALLRSSEDSGLRDGEDRTSMSEHLAILRGARTDVETARSLSRSLSTLVAAQLRLATGDLP